MQKKECFIVFLFFFRSNLSQRSINPLDEWEILREQIEYEEELGRGAFGVVYKAILWERVGIEVFSTEISKRKVLSSKTEPRVVAVKVLLGESKNEINARPYKSDKRQCFHFLVILPALGKCFVIATYALDARTKLSHF